MTVDLNRIRRLRHTLSIRCHQVKKFKVTTDSRHNLPVAPTLLNQNIAVSGPCQNWVVDITDVSTEQGWLYLSGMKDLWNGEIVGYAMSHWMTRTLSRAVAAKRPPVGLIHHSGRGRQYCSRMYLKLLMQFGMITSLSRKGTSYDNASRRASSAHLRPNWCTIGDTAFGKKRLTTSACTSKHPTTDREGTPALEIFPRRLLRGNSSADHGSPD